MMNMQTYYKVIRIQYASDNPNVSWETEMPLDDGTTKTYDVDLADRICDRYNSCNYDKKQFRFIVRKFSF